MESDENYDTEYVCKLIYRDRYIFDLRGWPNGINRTEFDRLWDLDFILPEDTLWNFKKEHFWNAGHFAYAVREAKKLNKVDKEDIWKAIEKYKEVQVKRNAAGWKQSFEWSLRSLRMAKEEKEPELVEHWKRHVLESWKFYNDCLKELELPEQPIPEILVLWMES